MTELKPKLSVAICTFNRAESLKECLESLTKQSFTDFEVIIVDADSTDQTPQVIDNYSQKLKIKKVIETGKGLVKARDLGWRNSQGEFVSWIDDDVVVSEDWAKAIVKILSENKDIAGVSGPTIINNELLKNRDVFFFYGKKGLIGLLGKFWNYFFLEGQMNEPGKLFKSGAWSPGANFAQSFQIQGLKDVDYLEACNMTLRRGLIEKANGFDFNYAGVAEWSELDLAIRIKKLGYRLIFSSKVKANHNISRGGVYPKRAEAKQRMENFLRFYFTHIFEPKPSYLFKFLSYLLFLSLYWIYKAISAKNPDWLSGLTGTMTGALKMIARKNI
ncbi:MAG: hypothetical protein UT22_C0010G0006 [Parcubacteria group bacterium GW2011_GWC2_39_11]|nr:MAG: hypothetical protein UT22_C0010G0006 [Parcubacteria group bacterium GW2011_GWC2_39_11]